MKYSIIIFIIIFALGCHNEFSNNSGLPIYGDLKSHNEKGTIQTNDNNALSAIDTVDLTIDTIADATAKFICGKNAEFFDKKQSTSWYKTHQTSVESSWNSYTKGNLDQISKWRFENKIGNSPNINTIFYPFSGPDFLYANAFFPGFKNYILLGLEAPGSLPDINSIDNTLLNNYLENIRLSLRYINKVGYFTTKQMKMDFSNKNLDGTIHLLLFYLSKTEHEICSVKSIFLDEKGNFFIYENEKQAGKNIKGIKIDFKSKDSNKKQTLYYFRVNASDAGMLTVPGFSGFIEKFGNVFSYVKSGSYLLHHDEFSEIRNFMMQKSIEILQDDSGISYKKLLEGFQVDLYGTYSKNISDFDYLYQADLHQAMINQDKNKELNFKLGYNKWHGETVLMHAVKIQDKEIIVEKKNTIETQVPEIIQNDGEKPVFMVQIKSTGAKISNPEDYFKGLPDISFFYENGYYKYTSGKESDYDKALIIRDKAISLGFAGSFIIAFIKGEKIDIVKAIKSSNK